MRLRLKERLCRIPFGLRYDSIDGNHQLSIAMDELDVRELAKECERALRKATTARHLMKDKVNVPTIISGEQEDA